LILNDFLNFKKVRAVSSSLKQRLIGIFCSCTRTLFSLGEQLTERGNIIPASHTETPRPMAQERRQEFRKTEKCGMYFRHK